jgi:hypothetical protein
MKSKIILYFVACAASKTAALGFLKALPSNYVNNTAASWAWLSYEKTAFAVLPGHFNRSVFEGPAKSTVSNDGLAAL